MQESGKHGSLLPHTLAHGCNTTVFFSHKKETEGDMFGNFTYKCRKESTEKKKKQNLDSPRISDSLPFPIYQRFFFFFFYLRAC